MSGNTPGEMALLVADVYELAGELRRSGDAIAATHGQTQARWQLLSVASEQSQSVARAARRLGVSRQAVQRVANDLVAAGLAVYGDNPDHRSSPLITLTPDGRRTLTAINHTAAQANRAIANGVDTGTVEAVRAGIRTLLAAIAESGQSSSS